LLTIISIKHTNRIGYLNVLIIKLKIAYDEAAATFKPAGRRRPNSEGVIF